MRWFETHRQEWIAETLRVFGFINRRHLEIKFGLSSPQASIDLQKFMKSNVGAMMYDMSKKKFISLKKISKYKGIDLRTFKDDTQ